MYGYRKSQSKLKKFALIIPTTFALAFSFFNAFSAVCIKMSLLLTAFSTSP